MFKEPEETATLTEEIMLEALKYYDRWKTDPRAYMEIQRRNAEHFKQFSDMIRKKLEDQYESTVD